MIVIVLYRLLIVVVLIVNTLQSTVVKTIPFKMWFGINNIIDSATHIFSNGKEYPYVIVPPEELQKCDANYLIEKMNQHGVTASIITQPINHKFDHSYLDSVLTATSKASTQRLYGIFLLNPQLPIDQGKSIIYQFKEKQYVGMRINPSLFPDNESISDIRGQEYYKYCGILKIPINIMCFDGGLKRYYDNIIELIKISPQTKLVIDHCGFFLQSNEFDEDSWQKLLSLSKISSNVYVKISALFRLSKSTPPFLDLDEKLISLVDSFGSNRLLWGSDFPYTEINGGYHSVVNSYINWPSSRIKLKIEDWEAIFGKTAQELYNIT